VSRQAHARERRGTVRRARSPRAKQRIAFALAVIDGRSLAEVAAITEASVVAVKTRVGAGAPSA